MARSIASMPDTGLHLCRCVIISAALGFVACAHAQELPQKAPPAPLVAQAAPVPARAGDQAGRQTAGQPATQSPRQLPADRSTDQIVELPGRNLKFKATAGSVGLTSDDGHLTAELAYVAYQLDNVDHVTRPVTFLFNGGPGSASAWVHIVGFGPWRLPVESTGYSPSASPALVANAETWLDFTDLVFIDPVGTGFSRMARTGETPPQAGRGNDANRNQGGARYFYSVNGDAESIADMIAKWLRENGRLGSPKILVGESYGGIRAPKVLHRLQTISGVGMNALVLISPVMDFGTFRGPRHHLDTYVNSLPTITAAAREAKGEPFTARSDLAEVESYARGEYLLDLQRGPRDTAAVGRIVKRVAGYSGLPEQIVRQYGGRLDEFTYLREANRMARQQASGYDATVKGSDADPTSYFPRWDDPFSSGLTAPVTSAMLELYAKLGWKTDLVYHLTATDALRSWQWGNATSSAESITQLQAVLALDSHLRVLVTHGATDLRTPYLGSVLLLDQLPAYADTPPGRVTLQLLPGGHMHYSREGSRRELRVRVKDVVDAVIAERVKAR